MKRPTKEIKRVLTDVGGSCPVHYKETVMDYIAYLESQLQPRKTVGDAVDCYKEWEWSENSYLYYSETLDLFASSRDYKNENSYFVCTPEQFRAEVERRNSEGAKGEMPELIEGDCIDCAGQHYYVYFNGMYYNVGGEQFMGIPYIAEKVTRAGQVIWRRKPPITHKEIIEMMERASFVNWTVADFMRHIHDDFELVD